MNICKSLIFNCFDVQDYNLQNFCEVELLKSSWSVIITTFARFHKKKILKLEKAAVAALSISSI